MNYQRIINSNSLENEIFVFSAENNKLVHKNVREFQRSTVLDFLRKQLNQSKLYLEHEDSGAPYLSPKSKFNISISHSGNWFAVQKSKGERVGVDIQVIDQDLSKGKWYFVNEQEELKHELTKQNLYLIWSAKEAVYKMMKGKVENYKDSIVVEKINSNSVFVRLANELITCSYHFGDEYLLLYIN